MAEIDPAGEHDGEIPPLDLSQAQIAGGPEIVPQGVHADGTLCYHGIALEVSASADGHPSRWRVCKDGQQTLVESYAPVSDSASPDPGGDSDGGWFLVPNPCPECGAKGDVEVRQVLVISSDSDEGTAGDGHEFRCKVCGASGPASPKPVTAEKIAGGEEES